MASGEQASLFRVSIYQTLRARGPDPNLAALSEAVDFCAESIESAGDCKVSRGEFRQHELWSSSLPLGRDVCTRRARKYPTVNAGDMVPLVGTKCGSPTGIPFAFADPGRTVELLNPYDEEHANHTLRHRRPQRESGKTMTANVLLSRCLAVGRARVRDRPRRPLRDAHPAGRRRAADRDRRRRLPVRAEPVGRAGPGEGLAGEDRVPARAAPGDDGRPGRAGRSG